MGCFWKASWHLSSADRNGVGRPFHLEDMEHWRQSFTRWLPCDVPTAENSLTWSTTILTKASLAGLLRSCPPGLGAWLVWWFSSSRPIGGMEGRMGLSGSLDTRQYRKGILSSIGGRNITINTGKVHYHQYGEGILPSIRGRYITINTGKEYYHQYGKGMLLSIWERNVTINMGKVYYHQYGEGILPLIRGR